MLQVPDAQVENERGREGRRAPGAAGECEMGGDIETGRKEQERVGVRADEMERLEIVV